MDDPESDVPSDLMVFPDSSADLTMRENVRILRG
jgi:hypothetical protein